MQEEYEILSLTGDSWGPVNDRLFLALAQACGKKDYCVGRRLPEGSKDEDIHLTLTEIKIVRSPSSAFKNLPHPSMWEE